MCALCEKAYGRLCAEYISTTFFHKIEFVLPPADLKQIEGKVTNKLTVSWDCQNKTRKLDQYLAYNFEPQFKAQ